MLKLEDIKTLEEAVVYLSHITKKGHKLTLDEIHLAAKTHGQNGMRNAYFLYSKMITDKFDDAYILLSPLLMMNSKRAELEKKIEHIMSLKNTLDIKVNYKESEVHPQAVFIAFYLLKNQVLPNLKPLNFSEFGGA